MAVAQDAISTAAIDTTPAGTFSGSINLTVGSGLSNGYLTIRIALPALATGVAVHWDSAGTNQAMTQLTTATNSTGGVSTFIFGLVAPTPGNKNVTVTGTGVSGQEIIIVGESWTGVDQTTPTSGAQVLNNSAGAANAVKSLPAITSATGNEVIAVFGNDFTWASTNNTQEFVTNGGTVAAAFNRAAGAASVTMSATNGTTADNTCGCGINLNAAASATSPFVQKDWPLPTPQSREPTLLSWIQSYKTLLYQGLDVLPVRQQEWQVPRSPEPYPYRSFEGFYNRNLIGKDTFFDGPGNGPDFEYQVPRSPEPYPYRTWTQNLLQTTLAPNLARPFNQYDWQVPRGAEPNWRRSWEFWFNYNLIGKDQFPVRQFNWQLPTAPSRIDQTWIVNLQLSTLAPVVITIPFRQFDWPVPQGYTPLVQNWAQPLNLNLQPIFMMLPFQWDIVEGQPFANPSSSQNLLLTTLSIPPAPTPFAQYDWPLPRVALQASPSWTWTYNPNLIGLDQLPVRQRDWQLPQTQLYVERTAAQNLLLTTLAPPASTAMPFRQLDWRLPDFFLR